MLWTGEYDEFWGDYFNKNFDVTRAGMNLAKKMFTNVFTDSKEDEDKLSELLKDKEIYLVGYDKVTKSLLDKCPDLKLILCVRDGPEESIDIGACTEKGIPVIFSGGRCAQGVAEYNMLLMLLMARPLLPIYSIIEKEGWNELNHQYLTDIDETSTELLGKTLGIVGLGRNGITLAKKAVAFGMDVIGYDPYVDKERAEKLGVKLDSLDNVLSISDYVTLLARVTPQTTGMISINELRKMKPSAALINTGRSRLTVQEDVFKALNDNVIRMAAIDVFDEEPLKKDSHAYCVDRNKLIITPHIAGYTRERVPHEYELLMNSLDKYYAGDKNITIKNPEVFSSPKFKDKGGKLFDIN